MLRGPDENDPHISDIISDALNDVSKICVIRAEYRIFDMVYFNDEAKSVSFGNEEFFTGNIIYSQLRKAGSLAVFLSTAGSAPGELSHKAMKGGDPLKGYIYDIIGSEVAESATDLVQKHIQLKMKETGRRITNRFSPGYCGWNVNEQVKLLKLMPYNFCGITLTPSALMLPVKSVSGFIGLGENVKKMPYKCRQCKMQDCIYRNKKN